MKKKLLNPFALVAQGFFMGALIFFATGSLGTEQANLPPETTASLTRPA